ncbi:MAG TPA: DUF1667 domain-containing protein [Spirochaetia bacterium]|nr:DUF1667 domain-containing protein [Spirochaetales bacterium]HRS66450.1 DUF1667 domain-containing protein [Spirochaetia bacterium]HOT59822.1 DUF1667 domain-containing protein [Spirochaetales bacterium]HPD80920.1 DUF1667 domain-containing protein [Spirochaetales bacterium]HQK34181.1 DUF1667 domain-containing protein [Spirochaetales bacterium]
METINNLVCIICPKGCRITIEYEISENKSKAIKSISGFSCPKGKFYAEQEILEPLRTLTTTIKTSYKEHARLAVRSDSEIPLAQLIPVIKYLRTIVIKQPISAGTCIVKNPLGLKTNIIAADDIL